MKKKKTVRKVRMRFICVKGHKKEVGTEVLGQVPPNDTLFILTQSNKFFPLTRKVHNLRFILYCILTPINSFKYWLFLFLSSFLFLLPGDFNEKYWTHGSFSTDEIFLVSIEWAVKWRRFYCTFDFLNTYKIFCVLNICLSRVFGIRFLSLRKSCLDSMKELAGECIGLWGRKPNDNKIWGGG